MKWHCCETLSLRHVSQDQDHVKPSLPIGAGSHILRKNGVKDVKLAGKVGAADQDQDAVEEYQLSSNTGKGDVQTSRFSTQMTLACSHKVSGE